MKPILVCLHGWGGTKESFDPLRAALKGTDIEILTPDLPGFGSEPEPKKAWSTDDYADWVERWIKKHVPHHNANICLLGHSHGGRISLKLAERQVLQRWATMPDHFRITHLYLCAAAGIRHPRHFRRIIGLTLAKAGKLLFGLPGLKKLEPMGKKLLYRLVRVHDYERASEVMRQTLIRVSRENLEPLLHTINVSTDLFWGKDDRMTPFSDALVMEKKIEDSVLHAFDNVRHAVHKDRAPEIAKVIRSQLA